MSLCSFENSSYFWILIFLGFPFVVTDGDACLEWVLVVLENTWVCSIIAVLLSDIFIIFKNIGIHIRNEWYSQKVINQFFSRIF